MRCWLFPRQSVLFPWKESRMTEQSETIVSSKIFETTLENQEKTAAMQHDNIKHDDDGHDHDKRMKHSASRRCV